MPSNEIRTKLLEDVTVLASNKEFDDLQNMLWAGSDLRIGLLLSTDGVIGVSSPDGNFIKIAATNDFLGDLDNAVKAAKDDYDVLYVPCLEEDAVQLGWHSIDLAGAAILARRHGIKVMVLVDDFTNAASSH